jgi:3-methylcrotonyl-CoA carboxylase alpha subunit
MEFLLDTEGQFYFMEMNTRLQVEHPVTEAITGQDLVEWQLRVAAGEPLPLQQDQLAIDGWAMEARLYAENPATGFLPSTGPLDRLRLPSNIRVDSGVEEGGEVTPFYDPMIAKLIVHAPTRALAAAKLAAAARVVQVWPVKTNAAFLARAAADAEFVAGAVDTSFIERRAEQLIPPPEPPADVIALAAAAIAVTDEPGPWGRLTGFRSNADAERRVAVEVGGHVHDAVLAASPPDGASLHQDGAGQVLFVDGMAWSFAPPAAGHGDAGGGTHGVTLRHCPRRSDGRARSKDSAPP